MPAQSSQPGRLAEHRRILFGGANAPSDFYLQRHACMHGLRCDATAGAGDFTGHDHGGRG